MGICGAPNPETPSMLCTKPEHPFGMHANDPLSIFWEGIPIPSPQDHKRNQALMEEIVLAAGVTVSPAPKSQVPALEYAGTSGWSGSVTSRDRAHSADSSGKTSERQEETLSRLLKAGARGMTWKDLSMSTEWHHGQSSGVLSGLHKAGMIYRLAQSRAGCRIYVHPDHLGGRETEDHGGRDTRTYAEGYEAGYAQAVRDLRAHG